MNPGRFDQRVTFRRRALEGDRRTGPLEDFFSCWGSWRPAGAQQVTEVNATSDAVAGTLTVRDTAKARAVETEHRVTVRGSDLEVMSAPIPDRSGYLAFLLTRKLGGT